SGHRLRHRPTFSASEVGIESDLDCRARCELCDYDARTCSREFSQGSTVPVEAKPLFRPDVLRPYVDQFQLPEHVEAMRPTLSNWSEMLMSGRADGLNETQLLPDFL